MLLPIGRVKLLKVMRGEKSNAGILVALLHRSFDGGQRGSRPPCDFLIAVPHGVGPPKCLSPASAFTILARLTYDVVRRRSTQRLKSARLLQLLLGRRRAVIA